MYDLSIYLSLFTFFIFKAYAGGRSEYNSTAAESANSGEVPAHDWRCEAQVILICIKISASLWCGFDLLLLTLNQ